MYEFVLVRNHKPHTAEMKLNENRKWRSTSEVG